MKPTVSVILPVYNGEAYLRQAVDSILDQTFKDFELIIINDGSTDNTQKIIDSYNDQRIKKISQANKGLVATLNRAIKLSRGQYVARHDADDISLPTRLEKQVKTLNDNPRLILVGTRAIKINEEGRKIGNLDYPTDDASIRLAMLSYTPFAHGSVMFRRSLAGDCQYSAVEWPAEDYGLWYRLIIRGLVVNLGEPLYKFRLNSNGTSLTNQTEQTNKIIEIRRRVFKNVRLLLKSPLTLRRALIFNNQKISRQNALMAAWVSMLKLRPLNAAFMFLALVLALPQLLKDN